MAKKLEWSTVKIKVKDLIELEINPRKISEEQQNKLLKSLERFGLVEIPTCNFDYRLIAGNQRVKILKMVGRGEDLIDVRYPNRMLTEIELKEYAITSNTHSGEWDFDILTAEFGEIDLGKFDLEIPEINLAHENRGTTTDNQEYTGQAKPSVTSDTPNAEVGPKRWFVYIDARTENQAEQMYEEMAQRGFETKVVN